MPRKNTPASSASAPQPPTTRLIAEAANVSNATVSMALRNSPLISPKTRLRVQKIAAKLGYRPDPQVAKLMHHLRQRHKPRFKSVIVALTTLQAGEPESYMVRVWNGIRRQADALGYGATLHRAHESDLRKESFWRTLRNRGVEGIVFLPQHGALSLQDAPTWKWFSVVTTTHSLLTPIFHRVVPDQFGNTLLICEHLEQMGRRRIGLLLHKESDLTVNHRISGAVAWQNTLGKTEPTNPLVYETDYAPALAAWFRRERPDAIVVGSEEHARRVAGLLKLPIPGPVVFAVTDNTAPYLLPGIDQCVEEVGAAAITVLNSQLQSGELGVSTKPRFTMIPGMWNPGLTQI